jgi:hypothetical protein
VKDYPAEEIRAGATDTPPHPDQGYCYRAEALDMQHKSLKSYSCFCFPAAKK